MSQQHTTQASGQGMLERVFKLREHGTTARTEVIAGFTTFLTMVYIVFVNPQILGVAGMDTSAVFVTTCLIAAFGSILMGLFANLPVALAPAMGLNAFFAFVVVQAMGLPWQVGMGAIFWGAVGLLLLTIFRVRYWMIANIPVSLRVGITSGIGLFIGMMGLKNAGVIVANPETLVSIGNLTSHSVLLGGSRILYYCDSRFAQHSCGGAGVHHRHDAAWLDDGRCALQRHCLRAAKRHQRGRACRFGRLVQSWPGGGYFLLHAGKPV
ncbi:xanthine/uracil permease family protein [Salmonella enterica subsp. enterica]|nr:xanthine/uracil permease family protein [Salmonella enterica subsp. enterica]